MEIYDGGDLGCFVDVVQRVEVFFLERVDLARIFCGGFLSNGGGGK